MTIVTNRGPGAIDFAAVLSQIGNNNNNRPFLTKFINYA